jgi:hypothetical protein
MTHSKAMEWQIVFDAGSGIRVYRLSGVRSDSRDAFTFIEQVRTRLRSDPKPVLLDLGGVGQRTSAGSGVAATIIACAQDVRPTRALSRPKCGARRLRVIFNPLESIATFGHDAEALAAHPRGGRGLWP